MGTKTDDLIVVSRDGVNYKATGTQLFDFEGGATFGGNLNTDSQLNVRRADDLSAIQVLQNGDLKASITAGGAATFVGSISAGGFRIDQLPSITTA